MTNHRFNDGDKVVLKDYETLCALRHVSKDNEVFERHYKYMKNKEPLIINHVLEPGDLIYSDNEENDISPKLRGTPCHQYLYNIQTPRSKLYLFSDEELEPYIEPDSD